MIKIKCVSSIANEAGGEAKTAAEAANWQVAAMPQSLESPGSECLLGLASSWQQLLLVATSEVCIALMS